MYRVYVCIPMSTYIPIYIYYIYRHTLQHCVKGFSTIPGTRAKVTDFDAIVRHSREHRRGGSSCRGHEFQFLRSWGCGPHLQNRL